MSGAKGFTLLEILLAIALSGILLSSIYGIFTAAARVREQVDSQSSALHLGRVLSERLSRELLGLSLTEPADAAALAGGTNSRGEAYLELVTHSRSGFRSGTRRVRYRLGPDQDNRIVLWRAEKDLYLRREGIEERLAQRISELRFEFYDGTQWRPQWNSSTDGRPVLVRVLMTLQEDDQLPPLASVFELPQSRGVDGLQ